MTLKSDKKTFRFTPKVFLRLIIFVFIVVFAFNYLSSAVTTSSPKPETNILGTVDIKPYSDWLYNQLPPQSKNLIENFDQNPVVIQFKSQINSYQSQLNGFPQNQIKEIQKQIIKNISDKLIESIEK